MEASGPFKVTARVEVADTLPFRDIRQSEKWGKYLEFLGWKSFVAGDDVAVRVFPVRFLGFWFGSFCKIQHPRILGEDDLRDIGDICRVNKCLFVKIEPGLGQDMAVLEKFGFKASPTPLVPSATIYMNLMQSEADLWGKLSRSGKYSVHRAQREGSRVKFFKNPGLTQLKEYYFKILKPTGKRQGFYVQPFRDLQEKVKIWGDKSFLALVYDGDDTLCGAKFFLAHKDMVLFVTGGTTEHGRKNKTGYDLLWQSILHFKGLGYKYLDLEGRTDPRYPRLTKKWSGFTDFKEKFGGVSVEFPSVQIKFLNLFLSLADKFLPSNL